MVEQARNYLAKFHEDHPIEPIPLGLWETALGKLRFPYVLSVFNGWILTREY